VLTVADTGELSEVIAALLADGPRRRALGERGQRVVEENRGALDRLMALVVPLLGERLGQRDEPGSETRRLHGG
jgi:3-deoxy-D-manno-octulosonic-acid transferase